MPTIALFTVSDSLSPLHLDAVIRRHLVSKGRLFKIQVRLGGSVNYLFADWSAV